MLGEVFTHGKFRVLHVDVTQLVCVLVSVRGVIMKVKRVFLAAMFCCCISISRLLQIRSVDDLHLICPKLFFFNSFWIYFKLYILVKSLSFSTVCLLIERIVSFQHVYGYLNHQQILFSGPLKYFFLFSQN